MTKQPYTYALLLPTLSPAAKITIYEDGGGQQDEEADFNELYAGAAIKSKERDDLLSREIKHIGINERNKLKDGDRPLLEIFVY